MPKSTVIATEELLARYNAGERAFPNIILSDIGLNTNGVKLEGVDFSGAIFRDISHEEYRIPGNFNVTFVDEFINCNFTDSIWEFCHMPALSGCNLQYAVMRGCFFEARFTDCDWRFGRIIGAEFDDMIFERCDLRDGEWRSGNFVFSYDVNSGRGWGTGNFGIAFINTLNEEIFSDIWTVWPKPTMPEVERNLTDSDDSIPF